MARNPDLDPAAILHALRIPAATSITPVHGGTDTAIWRVEHGSTVSALRVFRPEQAATQRREIAAMELARQAEVPVPVVHAAGIWYDRPVLFVSWCPGVPLWQAIRQQPWRLISLGMAFGRTQARIHRIRILSEQRDLHADWLDWASTEDHALCTALDRLAQPVPVLLHLDYHPLNVLADGRGITAVLDWANTRTGDPRADVARTYTILMVEPYVPGRQPLAIALARRVLTWSWWYGYRQVAGRLAAMPWFYAWAGAVMEHDLAPRVQDPRSWWQARHLGHIRAWTTAWRQRVEHLTMSGRV